MTSNLTPTIDPQIGSPASVGCGRLGFATDVASSCACKAEALSVLLMDLVLLPLRGK